eukprot:g44891.t1
MKLEPEKILYVPYEFIRVLLSLVFPYGIVFRLWAYLTDVASANVAANAGSRAHPSTTCLLNTAARLYSRHTALRQGPSLGSPATATSPDPNKDAFLINAIAANAAMTEFSPE